MRDFLGYSKSRDAMTREERDQEFRDAVWVAWQDGARANLDCIARGKCRWCNVLAELEILSTSHLTSRTHAV